MGTQQPLLVEGSVTVVSIGELRDGVLKQVTSKKGQDARMCQHGDRRERCPKRSTQQDPSQSLHKGCEYLQKWNKGPRGNRVTTRAKRQARARTKEAKENDASLRSLTRKMLHHPHAAEAPRNCETEREFLAYSSHAHLLNRKPRTGNWESH